MKKTDNQRIPSLRIAVTGSCNLKCDYCPIDGDNYLLKGQQFLDKEDFSHIAKLAYAEGIRHFSITGGEPLAVPKTTFAVGKTISKFKNLGYLRLNTNGLAVKRYADEIKNTGFHKLKISVDSLKTGKYQGANCRENYIPQILEGIDSMIERQVPVRINMVVGKFNINEVPEMIEFCEKKGLELKLFDMTFYRHSLSRNPNFWIENYVSLMPLAEELEKKFGKPEVVYAVGGFGNPMPVFKPHSGSPIKLRISEKSATYSDQCTTCKDYLCQDGFCNLTLTTDGNIKPCRPEGIDFSLKVVNNDGSLLPDKLIKGKIAKAISLFRNVQEKQRNLSDIVTSWKIK